VTVDAFQHWIYTHPGHTRDQRTAAWLEAMQRFSGEVDWSDYGRAHACRWHAQLHIFLYPFYYIEYGIAQLGALQVWAKSRSDKTVALDSYKQALRLGGSRPLPELFSAASCSFEFSRKTLQPLMQLMENELSQMKEK
jgi:oligoendopeptidase F